MIEPYDRTMDSFKCPECASTMGVMRSYWDTEAKDKAHEPETEIVCLGCGHGVPMSQLTRSYAVVPAKGA